MSNAELWDLDTSGGIMEQIQMLIAPPISADALRRSRRRREREVYRRPGRSVNHDCCDSCKEGGDLICCDRCPAAFHLLCHDPPLSEEELPTGEWLCHKCKISPQESKDEDTESTSSKSSNRSNRTKRTAVHIEADGDGDNPLKTLVKAARLMNPMQFDVGKEISCNKPLPGSSKRMYGKAAKNVPKKQAHELDNGLVPLPAKMCFSCNKSCRVAPLIQCDYCPLLFHLDCLNPPLTSLPTGRWMCPNHVEHFLDSHLLKSQSLTERLRLWDRYTGLVDSHTVKVDFLNKIHRKFPMFRFRRKLPSRLSISVPLAIKEFYQHPTVLLPDPARPCPLTSTGSHLTHGMATLEEQEEWLSSVVSMQASIAKYLAQKQIEKTADGTRSCEVTTMNSKPTASVAPVVHKEVEQETVNSDLFLELADCDRSKQQIYNGELTSNSPNTVADKNSSLSPWPPENLTGGVVSLLPNNIRHSFVSSPKGDADSIESSNGRQLEEMGVRARSNSADSIPSPSSPALGRPLWMAGDNFIGDCSSKNSGSKNIVINAIKNSGVVTKVLPGKPQPAKVIFPNNKVPFPSSNSNNGNERVIVQSSNKIQTTTPKVISVASSSSRQANSAPISQKAGHFNNIIGSSPTLANLNSMLQQWIEGNTVDGEFSKLDEQLTQILAWQRLQQLMPSRSPPTSTSCPVTTSTTPTNTKKGLLNVYLAQQCTSEVRSRAVLCPLSGKGQAIPMPYRSLSLGTGADMDVCLSQYGQCNFISGHHATIFYDEMSRHFELLNYSEHGTTVDNVLFSCDFSDKPATTPQLSPVISAVREMISKDGRRNGTKSSKHGEDKLRMSAKANGRCSVCSCKASSSSLIGGSGAGWEGTALLHHGSYIKVGCLQFVFSIVDHAPDQHIQQSTESSLSMSRFSSMPLLSTSQYLHNQPSLSLLKTQLKSSAPA
ncbi:PHD finger protein 12-like [Physella acuta]|uniref:PHD finger protein 12-like n=1 Tax=Physella acuta TaxID=109671 RepID=UPI0027DDEFEC|nr:PHD finger protein 12-like [Physella acuta]XP_059143695.1 PHD finger protein 12-like [Physella acuta]XP_059143696.1 PHD finger protein 12-like [Physella acuta]